MPKVFQGGAVCSLFLLALLGRETPLLAADGPDPSGGARAVISRLELAEDGSFLMVSAKVDAPIEGLNREALEGGIPFSFAFRFRLSRKGGLLGERVIRNRVVTHTLEYDPLRRIYLFRSDGNGEASMKGSERETADRAEALSWMAAVEGYPLVPVGGLEPGSYRVRAMATLRSAELPSVFGVLFFFTTLFNQDTPWRETDFKWR